LTTIKEILCELVEEGKMNEKRDEKGNLENRNGRGEGFVHNGGTP